MLETVKGGEGTVKGGEGMAALSGKVDLAHSESLGGQGRMNHTAHRKEGKVLDS